MGLFHCWCGERNGECQHTNPHIRALDSDDPEAYIRQAEHRENRTLRSTQTVKSRRAQTRK